MVAQVALDGNALRRTLEPLATARTLPADAYKSLDVFTWERSHFFEASWVCAGRSADLRVPGDQFARRVGSDEVLLARQPTGELGAYFNTCRHRGHELLLCGEAPTNRATIQCPYHRWTYGLDGGFKGGPGLASQPGFERRDPDHSLVPARAEEWGGWIFINLSGDGPALSDVIGNLPELVAPYEPERLVTGAAHSYEVAANWKVITENYHECYHCSEIHPELCAVSPPYSGDDYEPVGAWAGGSMGLMEHAETMSQTGASNGSPLRGLGERDRRRVHYVGLFPNLLISLHPDYVMTHRMEPLAPGSTWVDCTWLFSPEEAERPGFDPSYASDFWDITNRQDWAACESVQRGIGGRGYRQAPFSEHELCVHTFMSMVAAGYLSGAVVSRTRPATRPPRP